MKPKNIIFASDTVMTSVKFIKIFIKKKWVIASVVVAAWFSKKKKTKLIEQTNFFDIITRTNQHYQI